MCIDESSYPVARLTLGVCIVGITLALPDSTTGRIASQTAPEVDSAEVVDNAQGKQRRFERLRRDRLPWTYSSSGRCDIRIGRYCFRFDHGEPAWVPPPEDEDVVEERESLIDFLDSAQRVVPGDEWLITQLTRYLVEVGRIEQARQALSRCAVTNGWLCAALEGFVRHQMGAYESSERAFDRALQYMTTEQRCEWEDISDLVPGDVRGRLRSMECPERHALLDTLFWLADPLYTIPGNAVRSEHFSRQVVSLMYRQAKGPDPDGWNRSIHRITLRYGAPRGWQRIRGSRTQLRASLVTHYGTDGSAFFFPAREHVESPETIPAEEWPLDIARPQSNHDPAYAKNGFEDMTAEFAMFRVGDSTMVISTGFLSHDSVRTDTETRFAMFMTTGLNEEVYHTSQLVRDTMAVLTLTGPAAPHLVSVEALASEVKVAGRTRRGLDLTRVHGEGLIVSDLLVLNPHDSVPEQLHDALPHIRKPGVFHSGDRFTLYWELYGLDANNSFHSTTISLDKTSKGIFRRLAELTPFASHNPAVHVAWDQAARRNMTTLNRGLTVDLPDDLSDGEYRLTLTIETPAGANVQRTVELTVGS